MNISVVHGPGVFAEARLVAERRAALDDLLEREPLVDQRFDLIADDVSMSR